MFTQEKSQSDIKERAREVLAKVGLEHRLHHTPGQLSGGEQQRVTIARSLINNPPIILADEPTGNLDSENGKETMKTFDRLVKEGKTIVLITHDSEVAEHADRIISIRDGKIASDTKQQLTKASHDLTRKTEMRIFKNLRQAQRGLKLNRGNTLLMTLGVMVGIASLTVIVAIGFGIKVKVLDRISNLGFGPESFSVMAGAGKMFFSRSKNTTSMSLQDAEDLLALPTVRIVVPRQRKRMQIINKKEFTSTRVYGVTPDWQRARGWHVVDGVFLSDSDLDRKKEGGGARCNSCAKII